MVTRRHVLELAAAVMACALTGRALDASQAKVTTVTLTIEGMT